MNNAANATIVAGIAAIFSMSFAAEVASSAANPGETEDVIHLDKLIRTYE